ncbi:MAG: glutathione S-transferase N-terminal domain-containing protein [Pseudomonadota bacterium]
MKLYFSQTSPFVRKVVIAAQEKGLAGEVAYVDAADMDGLAGDNPLEKVPALVTDDGQALYDSMVICDYLDSRGSGPELIPADPTARSTVLCRHALADGIMEAGLASVMEGRRPEDKQWSDWTTRQEGKITRALDRLESEAAELGEAVDLSTIAVGAALGYVDFRLGHLNWRDSRPNLAAWFEAFSKRPSMAGTVPSDPA